MSLTRDVMAVHLIRLEGPEAEDDGAALKAQWREAVAVADPGAGGRRLHTGRAARLRALLMKHAGPNVNLIISPWKPDPGSTRAGPSRAGPAAPPS